MNVIKYHGGRFHMVVVTYKPLMPIISNSERKQITHIRMNAYKPTSVNSYKHGDTKNP